MEAFCHIEHEVELPPALLLYLCQMMCWQGFSRRGPETSQMFSVRNVTVSGQCPSATSYNTWPDYKFDHFLFLPKPQVTHLSVLLCGLWLSVELCTALLTSQGSMQFLFQSHGTQEFRMECCDHSHPCLRGCTAKATLSNSQGRLQRGFAQIVGEEREIFLCLFFSP